MSDARDTAAAIFRALVPLEDVDGTDGTGHPALRTVGRVAGLVARLVEKFGTESAEDLLERLLEQPPERADLDAMDAALARWRARQEG